MLHRENRLNELETTSEIINKVFVGEICVKSGDKWKLSVSFRKFLESVISKSLGRKVIVKVEFIKTREIYIRTFI